MPASSSPRIINVITMKRPPTPPPARSSSHTGVRYAALLLAFALVMAACGHHSITGQSGAGTGVPASPFAPGSPWSGALNAVTLPAPVNSIVAAACATASHCWAVGSTIGGASVPNGAAVIATSDGGSSWTAQSIPPTVSYLSGIACADTRRCVAVGQSRVSGTDGASISTVDGGASWSTDTLPPGTSDLTAVECHSDRQCMAIGTLPIGDAVLVSSTAGATWDQVGTLSAGITGASSVSCSDNQHCWVTAHLSTDSEHVTGVVVGTANGGATWSTLPIPPGSGTLDAVSCLQGPDDLAGALPPAPLSTTSTPSTVPTASTGPGVVTSSVPGSTSTSLPLASVLGVAGVRCTVVGTTSTNPNVARAGHGVILTSDNGGGTWTDRSVPATVAELYDVSCVNTYTCIVVGSDTAGSTTAGIALVTGPPHQAWQKSTAVDAPQSLATVSCVSTSHCLLAGESITEHLVPN
jgi:photosystem II stability/assembly factor-like uncharacterized protein